MKKYAAAVLVFALLGALAIAGYESWTQQQKDDIKTWTATQPAAVTNDMIALRKALQEQPVVGLSTNWHTLQKSANLHNAELAFIVLWTNYGGTLPVTNGEFGVVRANIDTAYQDETDPAAKMDILMDATDLDALASQIDREGWSVYQVGTETVYSNQYTAPILGQSEAEVLNLGTFDALDCGKLLDEWAGN